MLSGLASGGAAVPPRAAEVVVDISAAIFNTNDFDDLGVYSLLPQADPAALELYDPEGWVNQADPETEMEPEITVPAGKAGTYLVEFYVSPSDLKAGQGYFFLDKAPGPAPFQFQMGGNAQGDTVNAWSRSGVLELEEGDDLVPQFQTDEVTGDGSFRIRLTRLTGPRGPQGPQGPAGSMPAENCHIISSIDQAIPDVTDTPLAFDAEYEDNGGMFSDAQPTRIVLPTTGALYLITGTVSFNVGAGASRSLAYDYNGAGMQYLKSYSIGDGFVVMDFTFTVRAVAGGDYVRLLVQQDSGGALDALANFYVHAVRLQ